MTHCFFNIFTPITSFPMRDRHVELFNIRLVLCFISLEFCSAILALMCSVGPEEKETEKQKVTLTKELHSY